MIRAKYNPTTSLVEGYFPEKIRYNKNEINQETKTIDGLPYIEITDEEHQSSLGKKMCIVDGEFKEYFKPESELLIGAKKSKYAEVENLRKYYQFQNILYQESEFSTSQMARQNITAILAENNESETHYWKDIHENAFNFTLTDFRELSKLISQRDSKLYYIEAKIMNEVKDLNLSSIQSLNVVDVWQIHEANY